MQLLTDYHQYYDGIFDPTGPVFHRVAFFRGGLGKRQQFDLFARLGLKAPPVGRVEELGATRPLGMDLGTPPQRWRDEVYCVVYEDEFLHGGQGKTRLSLAEALERCPQAFASLYVPPAREAVNIRHLRLGRVGIWLRQAGGTGEWRSNRQDSETVLQRSQHPGPPPIPRVLWAIDFIPSVEGLLAIDFNTAPEMVTVGEANILPPEEIRAELDWAAAQHPEHLRQF